MDLKALIRTGVAVRLGEIARERAALEAMLSPSRPRRRRRPRMSAAMRKAVSVRMKKYWAARRKARR
jgi:hypothetical protein